jgi:hypothetical protein
MSWKYVYLIIAVAALMAAIWRGARGSRLLLPALGILWFLVVLFLFFIPDAYNLVLVNGVPSLGRLIHYVAIPVVIVLLLFVGKRRV